MDRFRSWKPVPRGLMSDDDFIANMHWFQDPIAWTWLTVFGSVGVNNAGRNVEGQARKVNENYYILTFPYHIMSLKMTENLMTE
jgi:hypothetical protein